MELIEFPEQTRIIAENQKQYLPMPVWQDHSAPDGRIICCWHLTLRERLVLLFTGRLWHHILTFDLPVQPQLLHVEFPFRK